MNVGEGAATTAAGGEPVPPGGPGQPGEPREVIDCRGQRCPGPVIELARRIGDIPVGAVVRVIADDPAAASDIPAWCRIRGHQFLGEHGLGEHGLGEHARDEPGPGGHGTGAVAAFDIRRLL